MQTPHFLQRFLLKKQLISEHYSPLFVNENQQLKKAAVLMPIVQRANGLHMLFTERALHLRHHPGQVSFPGGRFEHSDNSLKQTALRETHEEIGIHQSQVEVIGSLHKLRTVSGFEVTPFIGFIESEHKLSIDKQEVKSAFEVPLQFLLNPTNFHKQYLLANKKRHFTYCTTYHNHLIWGATAQMLINLQLHITK